MSSTIFVLGSNSFSGASFINYTLKKGFNVVGISRSPELDSVFLPYKWIDNSINNGFNFLQLDLNKNLEEIISTINDYQPEYIVNFAAQSMVAESWKYPEHWMQTNVVSTVKLHNELKSYTHLKKYVHISTPEVYGSCDGFITENRNYNPSTPYAVSRAACDMSLQTFASNYNFPVTFTRAANVYGPGQQLYRIIPKAILSILLGKKIPLHGGGGSVRSFIHIDDVADGTLKAMESSNINEIYHLSTKNIISIRELISIICNKLSVDFNKAVEVTDERPGKDAAYLLNSDNAITKLDWEPKISLDEGINSTIEWVQDNFDDLKILPMNYIHKE